MSSVKLCANLTVIEAHIMQDALAREGILAAVRHDHLASADIPSPGTNLELWVNEVHVERAKQVIAQAKGETESLEVTHCPNCGEENPATFARCWSCQASLEELDDEEEDSEI